MKKFFLLFFILGVFSLLAITGVSIKINNLICYLLLLGLFIYDRKLIILKNYEALLIGFIFLLCSYFFDTYISVYIKSIPVLILLKFLILMLISAFYMKKMLKRKTEENPRPLKNLYVLLIILTYSLSFFHILINDGIYQDDWAIVNQSSSALLNYISDIGIFLNIPAYIHSFVFKFKHALFILRFSIFLSFLAIALLLNQSLKSIKEIDKSTRFFIVAIFSIIPFFEYRISVATIHYALSNLLFFTAFFLLPIYFKTGRILYRVLILILFFFSFISNQFLPFYFIIFIFIIYLTNFQFNRFADIFTFIKKNADFFVIPFAFFLIKKIFFIPKVWFNNIGYSNISIDSLLSTLFNMVFVFDGSYWELIKVIIAFLDNYLFWIFLLSIFLYLVLLKIGKSNNASGETSNYNLNFLLLSFFILFMSSIAYLAVGAIPSMNWFSSRHQLLLPLGTSFLLVYLVKTFFRKKMQAIVFSFIIVVFVGVNIDYGFRYQIHWIKQESLIENFKDFDVLKKETSFIIEDNTKNYNLNSFPIQSYEYAGMFKIVFKDEMRCAFDSDGIDWLKSLIKDQDKRKLLGNYWNFTDYKYSDPRYVILIDHGDVYLLSKKVVLNLLYKKFFKKNEYKESIRNIVKISYRKAVEKDLIKMNN